MTADKIATYLLKYCAALTNFDCYMFGSTLKGIGHDIDILVVGLPGPALSQLKEEMRIVSENLPFHILYMQPSELYQTDFIAKENCVPLVHLVLPKV